MVVPGFPSSGRPGRAARPVSGRRNGWYQAPVAVLADLDLEPVGQRVDDGNAHTVQAAGHCVRLAVELTARVQHREDDLETAGRFWVGMHVDRHTAAVVEITRTPPSASSTTSMWSAKPASASSTELSTTSHTKWCKPRSDVDPMYMLGRLRTAVRPSRTVIELLS